MKGAFCPRESMRALVRAAFRPRPVLALWKWIDANVVIPVITGSTNPGPLRSARFPIYRGLYDLVEKPHVHFFLLCKSARVGGTLFSINLVLHKIAERPGPILWLDPTRKTAARFSRGEMQPFIAECAPVAKLAVVSRSTWTTLEMQFRACVLRLIGSGSAAELGGFQAEMVIRNERDKLRVAIAREGASADLAAARTKQFEYTRLIVDNSTPTVDIAPTWQEFLKGSQHYCYLKCPHCGVKQRLTFFSERKEVPFDLDGKLLPAGQTREEITGRVRFEQFKLWREELKQDGSIEKVEAGYDVDAAEEGATYECAHCEKDIEHRALKAMLAGFEWRSLNPKAPRDRISAHVSALYSPFERWGSLAKKFLLSRGSAKKLQDFHNSDLGLPFVRCATTVNENDIDLVVKRCPQPYVLGQIPFEPIILTITCDVQGLLWWWAIRAWGILWDHPEEPTWSALVDYGSVVSWEQIEELAGLKPDANGRMNHYVFRMPDGTVNKYRVGAGLIDAGFDAQMGKRVYDFCLKHSHFFSPSMGRGGKDMRGQNVRQTPAYNDQLSLVLYWDDWFKQELYYSNIKEGRSLWFLPTNLQNDYVAQITAERTVEQNERLVWKVEGEQGNHLGDAEKMQEVIRGTVEETLDAYREERQAEREAAKDEKKDSPKS